MIRLQVYEQCGRLRRHLQSHDWDATYEVAYGYWMALCANLHERTRFASSQIRQALLSLAVTTRVNR
jgi:hypothetical protein